MPGGAGLDSEYEAPWAPGSGEAPDVATISDPLGRRLRLLPTLWSRRGEFTTGSRGHDREMAWVRGTSYAVPHFVAVAATALAGGFDRDSGTPLSVGPDLKRGDHGRCAAGSTARQCVQMLRNFMIYPRAHKSLVPESPAAAAVYPLPVATEVGRSSWDFTQLTPQPSGLVARSCADGGCPDDSTRGVLLGWDVVDPTGRLTGFQVYSDGRRIAWIRQGDAREYHFDQVCQRGANDRKRHHFQVTGLERFHFGGGAFYDLETAGTQLVTVDCTDGIYLVQ